jgi:hypothetical protein
VPSFQSRATSSVFSAGSASKFKFSFRLDLSSSGIDWSTFCDVYIHWFQWNPPFFKPFWNLFLNSMVLPRCYRSPSNYSSRIGSGPMKFKKIMTYTKIKRKKNKKYFKFNVCLGKIYFRSYLTLKFRSRDFPRERRRGLKSRDFRALAVVRFETNRKRSRD